MNELEKNLLIEILNEIRSMHSSLLFVAKGICQCSEGFYNRGTGDTWAKMIENREQKIDDYRSEIRKRVENLIRAEGGKQNAEKQDSKETEKKA